MHWITRRARSARWLLAGALLGAVVTGTGVAAAASGTITACADSSGALKLNTSGTCKPSETTVTWNQVGPPGPAGPAGPNGATGPQGPQGPAGALVVQTVTIDSFSPGVVNGGTCYTYHSSSPIAGIAAGDLLVPRSPYDDGRIYFPVVVAPRDTALNVQMCVIPNVNIQFSPTQLQVRVVRLS